MDPLKIDELIELKNQISKDKNDNELLEKILTKLKEKLENNSYNLDELINSKIGKTVKDLLALENINSTNKNNVDNIMNLMKQLKIKSKDTDKEVNDKNSNKKEVVNKDLKSIDTDKNNSDKIELSNTNIKSIKEEFIKDYEPLRQTTRGLLFDALVGKDTNNKNVDSVKEIGDSLEKYIYKHLYLIEDQGNKYKNRIKTLVFNISVSLFD